MIASTTGTTTSGSGPARDEDRKQAEATSSRQLHCASRSSQTGMPRTLGLAARLDVKDGDKRPAAARTKARTGTETNSPTSAAERVAEGQDDEQQRRVDVERLTTDPRLDLAPLDEVDTDGEDEQEHGLRRAHRAERATARTAW